jgi:cobalt-zinc-cadmium efflux system membrane fusion protein
MKRFLILLVSVLAIASAGRSHEGEDHAVAPGAGADSGSVTGPIEVSEVAQRNLGLTVAEAGLQAVETTLRVIGEIQADPARSGSVTSRISGRVTAIFAQEGEHVEKGKPLVEVESLQLGDPPPRARYASPVRGVVTDRHAVVGGDVEPSRHLFEVADLSSVLAVGRVFEGQIGQVSIGQKVRVRVPSFRDDVFDGTVERLGGTLDPETRSLPVFVRVENADERLRPHMRATLSLVTGGAELALAIPKTAVLGEAGNFYAFVQEEERATRFERRPLVLGVANDRLVEVIDGILPGERVVSEGNYALQYLAPIPQEEREDDGGEKPATAAEPSPHAAGSLGSALIWVLVAAAVLVLAVLVVRTLRARTRQAREVR